MVLPLRATLLGFLSFPVGCSDYAFYRSLSLPFFQGEGTSTEGDDSGIEYTLDDYLWSCLSYLELDSDTFCSFHYDQAFVNVGDFAQNCPSVYLALQAEVSAFSKTITGESLFAPEISAPAMYDHYGGTDYSFLFQEGSARLSCEAIFLSYGCAQDSPYPYQTSISYFPEGSGESSAPYHLQLQVSSSLCPEVRNEVYLDGNFDSYLFLYQSVDGDDIFTEKQLDLHEVFAVNLERLVLFAMEEGL